MGTTAGSVALGAACTAVADCAGTGSCCQAYTSTTAGAAYTGSVKACFKAGQNNTTAVAVTGCTIGATTSGMCFLKGDACPAATGASPLAVSAAALATAVYVM